MVLDIWLYRQRFKNMAAPAQTSSPEPYYPVCELGRDFTLLSWVGKNVSQVENST